MSRVKKRNIRIQRMNDAELDLAIRDLEKRDFEVLDRGESSYAINEVKYKRSSKQPFKYGGTAVHKQVWAVLRRRD